MKYDAATLAAGTGEAAIKIVYLGPPSANIHRIIQEIGEKSTGSELVAGELPGGGRSVSVSFVPQALGNVGGAPVRFLLSGPGEGVWLSREARTLLAGGAPAFVFVHDSTADANGDTRRAFEEMTETWKDLGWTDQRPFWIEQTLSADPFAQSAGSTLPLAPATSLPITMSSGAGVFDGLKAVVKAPLAALRDRALEIPDLPRSSELQRRLDDFGVQGMHACLELAVAMGNRRVEVDWDAGTLSFRGGMFSRARTFRAAPIASESILGRTFRWAWATPDLADCGGAQELAATLKATAVPEFLQPTVPVDPSKGVKLAIAAAHAAGRALWGMLQPSGLVVWWAVNRRDEGGTPLETLAMSDKTVAKLRTQFGWLAGLH